MTTRTKAIFSLSSVFLIGLICGGAIVGLVIRDRIRDAERMKEKEGFSEAFLDRLEATQAQRDSLRGSLEQAYEEIRALRSAAQEEYQEVLDTLRKRVYPRLTAEQRVRYDRIEERVFPPELRPHRKGPPPISRMEPPSAWPQQPTAPATTAIPPTDTAQSAKSPQVVPPSKSKEPTGGVPSEKITDTPPPVPPSAAEQLAGQIVQVYTSQYRDLTPDQQQRIAFNVERMLGRLKMIAEEDGDGFKARRRMVKLAVGGMHKRIMGNILTETQRESYEGIPKQINQILRTYVREHIGGGEGP